MSKTVLVLIAVMAVSSAISQEPPRAAPDPSNVVTVRAGWPSIASTGSHNFQSLDGRFKISLPNNISGFSTLSPKQTGTTATGQQYTWKFAEVEISLVFLDFPNSHLTGSDEDIARIAENSKRAIVGRSPDAKIVSESQSKLNGVPSAYFLYELGPAGFTAVQLFIDRNRVYRFDATFKNASTEKYVSAKLNTFRLISQSDIDAELKRRYEAMRPAPLPQSPVVARFTTDAEDEGFKGKVKKVVEEDEDRSGTWGVQGRKTASIAFYDQNGSLTQRDSYDSYGKPFEITVYGYVDGKRASHSKTDTDNESLFSELGPPSPASNGRPNKSEPRYTYSHKYQYAKGKLIEHQLVYSNGKKSMRYVYNHSPNQIEELVYTDEGKLNQRYVSILDADGNEIERTDFGVVNYELYGDRKYRFSYEFDEVGNWIKKTTVKEIKNDGAIVWAPAYITYRTITYH